MSLSRLPKNQVNSHYIPTRHTDTSLNYSDLQDCQGLFTFNKAKLEESFLRPSQQARNHSEDKISRHKLPLSQRIKDKQIENQILLERIKSVTYEIEHKAYTDSNSVVLMIEKHQEKIEYFKGKLEELKNNEGMLIDKVDCEFIQKIKNENSRLASEISSMKEKIQEKTEKSMPKGEVEAVARRLKALEDEQFCNIQAGFELKKQLILMKKKNYERNFEVIDRADQDKLIGIYAEVSRILSIARKVSRNEIVKVNEVLHVPYEAVYCTPAEIIRGIKESLAQLKVIVSDLYAENVGSVCQTY